MLSSGILTFDKEKRGQATLSSGILINISITFDKEKRGQATLSSGIHIVVESPSIKKNEDKL